ncbi:hypothetical protein SLS53_003114 [Cytospora paraplurivora]|uniref:Aminotransferase class V domain-containing protein n=1 Tax=Cytospora paraplurivora TaxID=2898453 RepID=A0AAN9UBH9_9PEZI
MDIQSIRTNFPALGQDQVYFDNAGGSQILGSVVDSIRDYLLNSNVQVGATYDVSKKSTSRYEEGYEATAKYINASRDEIVLGASTTQLFRNLSATLKFQPGDQIILSGIDHEANVASWTDLAIRQQLVVKWWRPASTDEPKLLAADLEPLLSPRTRFVACTHASNVLGTIHDIKTIAATVHAACPTALVCVDGVAYAPHRRVDVKDLGVDIYAFSWYKVYGPHISVLYASAETTQRQMGTLGHFFNPHATLENKIGLAGASYELVSGIPAVTAYLEGVDSEGFVKHEEQLQGTLLEYLNGRGDVTVHGERSADGKVRLPTVSFCVNGFSPRRLVETIEKESRFGLKWGTFYSNRLVNHFLGLGEEGVVRVSLVHYNTVDEVKAFIAVLDDILSRKN